MRNIPISLCLLPAAVGLVSCGSRDGEQPRRPNILFIMTDDHTTQAMSCYGGRLIQTPNMDRIAGEGIRFDNCYATNALSGPSR
ncbi:MAG: sulfatase-like hydrolase/transferase, partial [Candidatus Cryptobacteroides sp.]